MGGIELRKFHLLHYRRDLPLIKQALGKIHKRQGRPKVKEERDAKISRMGGMGDVASCAGGSNASFGSRVDGMSDLATGSGEVPDGSYEIVIEKTFIMVRPVKTNSEDCAR